MGIIKKGVKVSCSLTVLVYHCVSTKKHNDMSNLHSSYNKIEALLHELDAQDYYLNQIRLPRLTDKQLIAFSLAAESLGIDSERYLFKRIPHAIKAKIERSVHNRRRRRLAFKIEQFRQMITNQMTVDRQHHIIDSMPLEVCRFSRAKRSRICRDTVEVSPDYGYCAAQKTTYFGYKFHAVCSSDGVFQAFDITQASVHDIHYLEEVKTQFAHCVLIGDKGYLSQQWQEDLFEKKAIRLATPQRRNQPNFEPFNPILRKARKRIETLYSQLCDQFMIRRNYAKSFTGLTTRIVSKVTALTLMQWFNQRNGNHINNLKIVIA